MADDEILTIREVAALLKIGEWPQRKSTLMASTAPFPYSKALAINDRNEWKTRTDERIRDANAQTHCRVSAIVSTRYHDSNL